MSATAGRRRSQVAGGRAHSRLNAILFCPHAAPAHSHPSSCASNSSVSSQDRFKIGAFAGGGDSKPDNLPSLEEELAGEPLLQLLPRARPSSAISVTSGETVSETRECMMSVM